MHFSKVSEKNSGAFFGQAIFFHLMASKKVNIKTQLVLFEKEIRAGSAMFIRRKLALQGIPIKRRGGSRKIFVSIFQFIVESYQ
jgi:hypothetical protein